MRPRSAMIALAALVAATGDAAADRWSRLGGGALPHYELTAVTALDRDVRPRELVLAGVRLRGFVSPGQRLAYLIGLDLAAGATIRGGGFAYDVALLPLGAAVRLGETSVIGIATGVGASGATGTLDDAVTLPVDAIAELGGGRLRVIARARVAFVAGAASRQGGAPSLPIGDELDALLALRIGHHYGEHGFPTGNGYFVGGAYRELAGARFVGLAIGYSIDMATPRRRRR